MNISQVKLKVLERSTGNKKVEEWTFLPKDWNYDLKIWDPDTVIFEKNFALLKFFIGYTSSGDDILLLNLVTRKLFWMRTTTVKTQMKEKAAGQVDFGGLWVTRAQAYQMFVESDRLVIRYSIRMTCQVRAAELG